jgi:hypothetical protein
LSESVESSTRFLPFPLKTLAHYFATAVVFVNFEECSDCSE